jgi:tRNA threonylcarbamoyl adenosine modification protein (Sua5/YciO/YrdC/YwlC family)
LDGADGVSGRALERAVDELRSGALLAYPTETLFGLGADGRCASAVERLRKWKGRDADRPLSILVESSEALERLGVELSPLPRGLTEAFWPGPLTLVLHCPEPFAPGVAREDGAVGFRCSAHPVAAALARRVAREGIGPLTATSLNRSGEAPARTRAEALRYCDGRPGSPILVDVPGAEAGGGAPSSVVDMTGSEPRMLREGAISSAVLTSALEENRCA